MLERPRMLAPSLLTTTPRLHPHQPLLLLLLHLWAHRKLPPDTTPNLNGLQLSATTLLKANLSVGHPMKTWSRLQLRDSELARLTSSLTTLCKASSSSLTTEPSVPSSKPRLVRLLKPKNVLLPTACEREQSALTCLMTAKSKDWTWKARVAKRPTS